MWRKLGCEYVHLTGGEPTLVEYLPELVKAISSRNMRAIITSNATSNPSIYEEKVINTIKTIGICVSEICSKYCADITAKYNKYIDKALDNKKEVSL